VKSQLLESVPEITNVHELHIWRLTDEKIVASAHLNRKNLSNYMVVADKVKKFFHSLGIHSVTIQYESDDYGDTYNQQRTTISRATNTNGDSNGENKVGDICLLRCEDDACDTQSCCTKEHDQDTNKQDS
jgi:hypothetical protein